MKLAKKNFPTADNIIDKLKLFYSLPSDASLAELLEIRPNTLAIWKVRNSIDLQRIVTHCPSLDLNWLVDENNNELPATALIVNKKPPPAIFDHYRKHSPSNEEGYVYTIDISQQVNYPSHGHLKTFLKKLSGFKPPAPLGWKGVIRMFQCNIRQMEPWIKSYSWVICRYIAEPWNAATGKAYIAVTTNKIYWGRLIDKITDKKQITLQPIDQTFRQEVLAPQDLKELWLIEGHIQEDKTI